MGLLKTFLRLFYSTPTLSEVQSPKIRINEGDVNILGDSVIFNGLKQGSVIAKIMNTNSMDPVFDNGMLLVLEPTNFTELIAGDIISYWNSKNLQAEWTHRIESMGIDMKGWYCIPKGDNNLFSDGKIRASQVTHVVRAIIW